MSEAYYARPVTVTDERVRDAMEKQAKQRALREALDSQIQTRVAEGKVKPAGLSKVQQKRQELLQMQHERQPPPPSQSTTTTLGASAVNGGNMGGMLPSPTALPPNYAFSSSLSFGGGGPPPFQRQSNVSHYPSAPTDSPVLSGHANGLGGDGSVIISPTSAGAQLQNPNFNLAEMYYAQVHYPNPQLQAGGSAVPPPPRDFPVVPLSPRQLDSNSPVRERTGMIKPPQQTSAQHGVGRGLTSSDMLTRAPPDAGLLPTSMLGGDGGVQGILRMARRVTDQPTTHPTGHPAQGNPPPHDVAMHAIREQLVSGVSRSQSKEAKGRNSTPINADKGRERHARVNESRVEKLQKELQDRQHEMQRMRDKERDWEDQVKHLKMELKNARQKERDLSKMVQETGVTGSNGTRPQRAETAPNTGSISKLAPLQQQEKRGAVGASVDVRQLRSNGGHGALGHGAGGGAPAPPARKDFNQARVFSQDTFRPITAPLEPIDAVVRSTAQQQLPPLPDSLKFASFNTRKTAFGLHGNSSTVPLTYEQLTEFVRSQVVTQSQADTLWTLFTGEDPPKRPSPPPGSRPRDPSRRSVPQEPQSPTYETYEELDAEDEYVDDDDER